MKPRLPKPLFVFALAVSAVAVAACGGGGGGSSSVPSGGGTSTPVVTPTPSGPVTPTPQPSGPSFAYTPLPGINSNGVNSVYTFNSNPSGLQVTLNGTSLGLTPVSTTPATSQSNNFALFTGSTTCAYTPAGATSNQFQVQFLQTQNGNHTIFYNQQTDTCGSINTASITSAARRVASIDASTPRFTAPKIANLPGVNPNRLIVAYRTASLAGSGRSASDIERANGVSSGLDVLPAFGGMQFRAVNLAAGRSADSVASALKADPNVSFVEPAYYRYKTSVSPTIPNDTHFDTYDQWDMYQIGAPYAWSIQKGSVPIAIIDTGFDNNQQDLQGKVVYAEKVVGGIVTTGLAAAQDTDGHGTNVSGIAADNTNNSFGFAGVGWANPLMEFKIFPDGPNAEADTGDEARAIYDAVANGAKVINLSLGSTESGGVAVVEQMAVEYAISQNVVVVAAAGNDSLNQIDYPAAYDGVISVGATSLNDNNTQIPFGSPTFEYVSSYSNYGPGLGLVAPGGDPSGTNDTDVLHWIYNIYTTTPYGGTNGCKNINDCKALFAGTSQATPHVSGAVGLILSQSPGLTPAQVAQLLYTNTDIINNADPKQGHGRLDIYKALAALTGSPVNPPASASYPGGAGHQAPNYVAFAYNNSGATSAKPNILDVDYPNGVPLDKNGNFRISDVPPQSAPYKIGVWLNVNGNGVVTAGDQFASVTCPTTGPCSAAGLNLQVLTSSVVP